MTIFDYTPIGAFVNAVDAASKSDLRYREPAEPVEEPRKPIARNLVMRIIGVIISNGAGNTKIQRFKVAANSTSSE